MSRYNVLFLCTGNSCRSQMAEGLVNHVLGDRFRAFSAGTAPSERVHPLAIRAMDEIGVDISHGYPKTPDVFHHITFDLVVTVCDDAAERCPLWLREGRVEHVGFYDPARAEGSEEERMAVFRRVRDEIRARILPLLSQFEKDHEDAP